jgi:hypothetical protein
LKNVKTPPKTAEKVFLPERLKPIAEALGTLAVIWGSLELGVSNLLATMLKLAPGEAGAVVTGNIQLKSQLEIIKHMALILKPSDKWYQLVINTANNINCHLCTERNRMFHDFWTDSPTPEKMTRITLKPKLEERQDGKGKQLKQQQLLMTADMISNLTYRVMTAHLNLNTATHYLNRHFERAASFPHSP